MTQSTKIVVTLSTVILAAEFPTTDGDSMDSSDHRRIGDAAVEAVETHLRARHPEVEIEVDWSRGAMMRHHIAVEVDGIEVDGGNRFQTDVRDDVLEALEAHLRAA